MDSEINSLLWEERANQIELEFPVSDEAREREGVELVRILRTFGAFYGDLLDRKNFDREVAARRVDNSKEIGSKPATLTIGGLAMTAKIEGAAGNAIEVKIETGVGSSFTITNVDPKASAAQLAAAISALDGEIAVLSNNPVVAAAQQQAAEFMKSLPDDLVLEDGSVVHPRAEAKQIIESRWDDTRTARDTLQPAHVREDTQAALEAAGLDSDSIATAMEFFDAQNSNSQAALKSIFSMTATFGDVAEAFPEVPAGFPFPLMDASFAEDEDFIKNNPRDNTEAAVFPTEEVRAETLAALEQQKAVLQASVLGFASDLIASAVWSGTSPPPPGLYQFSGGEDGSTRRFSAQKRDDEYVYDVAGRESFTLPQLRAIVASAIEEADRWLLG